MKNFFLLLAFIGIAGTAMSQDLICAWHFDTLQASPNTQVVIPADSGIMDGVATIYLDGTAGSSAWGTTELNSFGGTLLNDGRLTPMATSDLAVVNSSANGKSMVIGFSTFGYENPILSYATRGSGTGFSTHVYAYSTDGITYTNFDTVAAVQTSTWILKTIDLTSYDVLDNSPVVYIRITFDGATSTLGNNRLDNISIYASSISGGDIVPPVVQSAAASSASNVWVVFNEAVGVSAENTANYSGLGTINTAVRTTGLDSVQLTLATPLTFGVPDTVCVDNVADTAGNVMLTSQCFEVQYGVIDLTPPAAISAWAVDINTVMVKFDEALKDTSAQNIAHYTGLTPVSTAVLSASLDTVTLNLSSSLTSGVMDTLYVEGVRDTSNNIMAVMQMFQIYIDTSTTAPNLVITEIMYNPPESGQDSLEFIEIYNNGSGSVNIFNYELNYGATSYTFDSAVFIAPASYFLIGIKADKAAAFYGMPFYQGPSVGLGNSGTTIEIRTAGGLFVDSVMYDDVAPWPTEANGNGYSLSFCDPNLDNNIATNWGIGTNAFSVVNGSMVYANPGQGCTPAVDTVPPVVTSAWATDFSTVKVRFNEAVETSSGQNTANYTGLGTVNTAVLNTGIDTVTLSLATPLVSGVPDTLYVTGINDLNANLMTQVYEFIILLDTSSTSAALVITEIMYNPPESGIDSLEFIEIYNNDVSVVNLLDYKISYGTTFKVLDVGYNLNPGAYAVISMKPSAADAFYGITSIPGPAVGISNGGTSITLHSPTGLLVDSVAYLPTAPWPIEANGGGHSLTLCDPSSDNNDATNWSYSANFVGFEDTLSVFADPGMSCVVTSIMENAGSAFNVYPNPANNVLHIDGLENAEAVSLYNAMGALIQSSNISGENSFEMNLQNLPEALYIVRVRFNNGTMESRMVMIAR
ncbi:MAG: lamin tail domain-containing protein [Bacteroidales bacterium]|nr:lamin tail domain-containing protein [Bacteroidales bacterium]